MSAVAAFSSLTSASVVGKPGQGSKIPALVDRSGPDPIRVFESGAILLYLAEKFGAFLPRRGRPHAECLSWLFWQMGSAPYLGGGFGHFYAYAPVRIEYAIDRFAMETKRLLDVLDRRLADNEYVAGPEYTIADMAIWPWYGGLVQGRLYEAGEFLSVQDYRHVRRWADAIGGRPAVKRGRIVYRASASPPSSCTNDMMPAISIHYPGQVGGAGVTTRVGSSPYWQRQKADQASSDNQQR